MNRTCLVFLVGSLLFCSTAALAQDIRLEEDAIMSWGNIGGDEIRVDNCDGAENGMALYGVDTAGEWFSYGFVLTSSTCFVDSLRSAGDAREYRDLQIEFFLDPGFTTPVATDTFSSVEGQGIG